MEKFLNHFCRTGVKSLSFVFENVSPEQYEALEAEVEAQAEADRLVAESPVDRCRRVVEECDRPLCASEIAALQRNVQIDGEQLRRAVGDMIRQEWDNATRPVRMWRQAIGLALDDIGASIAESVTTVAGRSGRAVEDLSGAVTRVAGAGARATEQFARDEWRRTVETGHALARGGRQAGEAIAGGASTAGRHLGQSVEDLIHSPEFVARETSMRLNEAERTAFNYLARRLAPDLQQQAQASNDLLQNQLGPCLDALARLQERAPAQAPAGSPVLQLAATEIFDEIPVPDSMHFSENEVPILTSENAPTPAEIVARGVAPGTPTVAFEGETVRSSPISRRVRTAAPPRVERVATSGGGEPIEPARSRTERYTVKPGDSLRKIAKQLFGNENFYTELRLEGKEDTLPNVIHAGEVIVYPRTIARGTEAVAKARGLRESTSSAPATDTNVAANALPPNPYHSTGEETPTDAPHAGL